MNRGKGVKSSEAESDEDYNVRLPKMNVKVTRASTRKKTVKRIVRRSNPQNIGERPLLQTPRRTCAPRRADNNSLLLNPDDASGCMRLRKNSIFGKQYGGLITKLDGISEEAEINFINPIPSSTMTGCDSTIKKEKHHQIVLPDKAQEPADTNITVPECPICYKQLINIQVFVTPCGHTFCTQCIKNALAVRKVCPTCRQKCLL